MGEHTRKAISYPYPVNYNDHFETPLLAYKDLQPLIDWLWSSSICRKVKQGRNAKATDIAIYDPYYCDGRTRSILAELGYRNVLHEKRDFYKDVMRNTVPEYDLLLTNPPYSDQHKTKCLEYCFSQLRESNKPFCILMPNYVASRQYFRNFLMKEEPEDVVYLIPTLQYQYDHPEGTGKDKSPFDSLWFCGIGRDRAKSAVEFWKGLGRATFCPKMAASLRELEDMGAISTQKRPNPKQRRKIKRKLQAALGDGAMHDEVKRVMEKTESSEQGKQADMKAKYRDEAGKRTKRRF